MAGAGTSCTHSASPNNGRAAMARAARCSKRRVMIIGNPPLDVRAASLFLCETQSDGTQLSRGTDSCGLRQIASIPDRQTLNTLHLRSCWRDDRGCGLLQRALADVTFGHRSLRVGRCQAAAVEQHGNLVAGSKLTVSAAPLVDEAKSVPLVVCATADRRRCAQRIIFAKRGLGEPVLHSRREFGV